MLYHDACKYVHLFLYEYQRRYEPHDEDFNAPYVKPIDRYLTIIDSVLRYGDIPLGNHGYVGKYAHGLIDEIKEKIRNYCTYAAPETGVFREVVYKALVPTFLYARNLSGPRKKLRRAIDEIIPRYM